MDETYEYVQMKVSLILFSFTILFLLFSVILLLFHRSKPWCHCHVCATYLNGTWRSDEFPNLSDWYAHLLRRSPTQTIHVHVLGNIITANPGNVEYMLKTNFDNFPKGPHFSSILGDLLGHGIFNVDGPRWRFQRKMASLELGSLSVRSYAFSITSTELRHRLIPLLRSSSSSKGDMCIVDLQDVFRRFSFDTICRISFGLDPGCLELGLPFSEFAHALDQASCLSAKRALSPSPIMWKLKRLLNLGSERELKRYVRLINALAGEVIRQRRKLGPGSGSDLLSRFMESVDDDKYLRDIVVSFLLAGRDTVASGLTTLFLLLSRHPEVVSKMRREIIMSSSGNNNNNDDMGMADVMNSNNNNNNNNNKDLQASYGQLRSMNYVHAVIYESLRLFPPVQFDSKFSVEDDVLPDGTYVGENTRVTYHAYAMGRMETIWGEDCHQFRPERWLSPETGKFVPESSPYRYPVFQGGQRVCVGKEMALMEMKTVAVAIIREFDVEPVGCSWPNPIFSPGLSATLSGGLPVRVHRRCRSPNPTN